MQLAVNPQESILIMLYSVHYEESRDLITRDILHKRGLQEPFYHHKYTFQTRLSKFPFCVWASRAFQASPAHVHHAVIIHVVYSTFHESHRMKVSQYSGFAAKVSLVIRMLGAKGERW